MVYWKSCVVEKGIALLLQFGMLKSHWIYSFKTIVFLINRLPSKSLNHISPYELLYDRKLDYTQLNMFGLLPVLFLVTLEYSYLY